MKMKAWLAAIGLCAAALPAAACTQTFSLGTMGPPDIALFGNTYTTAQSFKDCYAFSLSSSADAVGVVLQWDNSNRLDIDLLGVSLLDASGALLGTLNDMTSPLFQFSNLFSGSYQLAITGQVTNDSLKRANGTVGYTGLLSTTATSVAAPVPEAETVAMLALGLGVIGWSMRRKSS
jgi:hypothetical protein